MNDEKLNELREQLFNLHGNLRDDNGDYLFDEKWLKENILGEKNDRKENLD